MKAQYIFPSILILINFASAIVSGCCKDFRMSLYWVCAAVLNICVTFK